MLFYIYGIGTEQSNYTTLMTRKNLRTKIVWPDVCFAPCGTLIHALGREHLVKKTRSISKASKSSRVPTSSIEGGEENAGIQFNGICLTP